MELCGKALGCLGMSSRQFWEEMTVMEFFAAYNTWWEFEKAKLGIKDESPEFDPVGEDEYKALLEADRQYQERLKRKETERGDND